MAEGELRVNSKPWWDGFFSTQWEKNRGREQTAFFMRTLLERLPWAVELAIEGSQTILDWGCALGDGVAELARRFPAQTVQGLDVSPVAIEKAREAFPQFGFFTTPLEQLGGRFDVLVSSNCLEHFEHPLAVLEGCLAHTRRLFLLMVPFAEKLPSEYHDVSFGLASFPQRLGRFSRIHQRVVDTRGSGHWEGDQLVVVYASRRDLAGLLLIGAQRATDQLGRVGFFSG